MMNSKIIFIILLVVAFILSGCSTGTRNEGNYAKTSDQEVSIENEPTNIELSETTNIHETTKEQEPTKTSEPTNEIETIKEQIEKMTLDEKIGQMLIVGFKGYEINENIRSMI